MKNKPTIQAENVADSNVSTNKFDKALRAPHAVPHKDTGVTFIPFIKDGKPLNRGYVRLEQTLDVVSEGALRRVDRFCRFEGNLEMLEKLDFSRGKIVRTEIEDLGLKTILPPECARQVRIKGERTLENWELATVRNVKTKTVYEGDTKKVLPYVTPSGNAILVFHWFSIDANTPDTIVSGVPTKITEVDSNE